MIKHETLHDKTGKIERMDRRGGLGGKTFFVQIMVIVQDLLITNKINNFPDMTVEEIVDLLEKQPPYAPRRPDWDAREWMDITTIPTGRRVEIESATGIICTAKVQGGSRIRSTNGRDCISCFGPRGDIVAVRWREMLP